MLRKLIVIMVGLALLGGFAAMEAQAHGKDLVLRVVADGTTFDQATADTGAMTGFAFFIQGDICEETAGPCNTVIGTFLCWGWNNGGLAVVSQEFNLFDRGKIQTQGVEDLGPRAVVGGTGDFRNVRGEVTVDSPTLDFTATFELIGAKRNKKDDD